MRARTVSASLVIAASLLVAPLNVAMAETVEVRPGVSKSTIAKAKVAARKLERQAKSHRNLVLGGKVTAVVGQELSFTVHGHRYKALRGTTVTVSVDPAAKVTRDGVVTLAQVVAGDHVVVKSRDFDFVVSSVTDPVTSVVTPTVTLVATVTRVAASPAEGGSGSGCTGPHSLTLGPLDASSATMAG